MTWESIENAPFADDPFSKKKASLWEQAKQHLPLGTILKGPIYARTVFGIFFDAGVGFPVLMKVTDFDTGQKMIFPDNYPQLNSLVTGELSGFDDENRQIVARRLSTDRTKAQ